MNTSLDGVSGSVHALKEEINYIDFVGFRATDCHPEAWSLHRCPQLLLGGWRKGGVRIWDLPTPV